MGSFGAFRQQPARTPCNALGQLKDKTLGSGLDTMAYDYNIRGWPPGANSAYLANVSATGLAGTGARAVTALPA